MKTSFYDFINERIMWTNEMLQDEANKYSTRLDLKKNNYAAYSTAWARNLLDELFKDHPNEGRQRLTWDVKTIQDLANKCKTKHEFVEKYNSAAQAAQKRGIMGELFKNHPNKGHRATYYDYWTKEKLQDEANKYKTRQEFNKNNSRAYQIAVKKDLIDDLFKDHNNQGLSDQREFDGFWTKERLQKEANKCQTRIEFQKKYPRAYNAASKKKMIDELFSGHFNDGYLDREEWKENSYVIYVYELKEFNKAYVGLTNDVKRRDIEHLWDEKTKLNNFCRENNLQFPKYKILEEDLNSIEARNQEIYWVNFYKENGWEMFNIAKPGSIGGNKVTWTRKKLKELASKYKTRKELRIDNPSAYDAALKYKIVDDLFKDHSNKGYLYKEPNEKTNWTKEMLQEEANKYKTRREFLINNTRAYNFAYKHDLLNDLFKNHPNQGFLKKKVKLKNIKNLDKFNKFLKKN